MLTHIIFWLRKVGRSSFRWFELLGQYSIDFIPLDRGAIVRHFDSAFRAEDNIDLNIVDLKVVSTDDVIAWAGARITWLIICIPIST